MRGSTNIPVGEIPFDTNRYIRSTSAIPVFAEQLDGSRAAQALGMLSAGMVSSEAGCPAPPETMR